MCNLTNEQIPKKYKPLPNHTISTIKYTEQEMIDFVKFLSIWDVQLID